MSNLGQLSKIEYLELYNYTISNGLAPSLLDNFSPSNPMVFPSLVFIYLWTIYPDDASFISRFLESLSAPGLVALLIAFTDTPSAKFPRLREDHDVLTALTIAIHFERDCVRRDTLDEDILSLLRSTRNVTVLRLEFNTRSSRVLRGLCADATQLALLPRLTTFAMTTHNLDEVLEDVVALVASRGPQRSSTDTFCCALEKLWLATRKDFKRQEDLLGLAEQL